MKKRVLVLSLLIATPLFAKNVLNPNDYSFNSGDSGQDLVQRLSNMGAYFGYDISTPPGGNNQKQPPVSTLLNGQGALQYDLLVVTSQMANRALATSATYGYQIIPQGAGFDAINTFANQVFQADTQSASQNQNGIITTSPLVDQKPYQNDPVSQAVLNVIGTPEFNYCKDSNGNANQNCLFQTKVWANVIGTIPNPTQLATFQNNPPNYLNQINANSLLGPMMYSQPTTTNNNTNNAGTNNTQGLSASNTFDAASHFVRYATGLVNPINLVDFTTYDTMYAQLFSDNPTVQLAAKQQLTQYLASLRVYTSQVSVAMSNIYFLFSKRVPIVSKQAQEGTPPTSQALNEFQMASYRLFNTQNAAGQQTGNTPWIEKINTASPATVQKEMALLLAEINYQLYLNRQQEERVLLTNSILLLLNAKQTVPILNSGN